MYSSYTEADYDVLWKEYLYIDPAVWWISRDLGKYHADSAQPFRSDTHATAQGFWVKQVCCGSLHKYLLISGCMPTARTMNAPPARPGQGLSKRPSQRGEQRLS